MQVQNTTKDSRTQSKWQKNNGEFHWKKMAQNDTECGDDSEKAEVLKKC